MGGIPNWIVAKARPGTNEVMAVFFNQNKDTNTEYFNGGAYISANWTNNIKHSGSAADNIYRSVDFDWSPNNSKIGALIYSDSATDRSITAKVWTANDNGGGSWRAAVNSKNNTDTTRFLADLRIIGRPGTDEFLACSEDNLSNPKVSCFALNMTPSFSTPTNYVIANPCDSDDQRGYDISYTKLFGSLGLSVYSDQTNVPKLKKYNAQTHVWDSSGMAIGTLSGGLKSVTLRPDPKTGDILILMGDANNNLYSEVWDSANSKIYTSPSWKAFTNLNAHGSDNKEYWFDFAWDN
jgi:hypothetical protein